MTITPSLIAALTFGSTFSASSTIERLPSAGIAPVLAGVEERAEVADMLAEFQDLVGDLVRRAVDDQIVADAVERDFVVGLVAAGLEQLEPAAFFSLVKSWL